MALQYESITPLPNDPDAIPGTDDIRRLLVVTAHPDDESFGLGGIVTQFAAQGVEVSVLCLTRGEISTLGAGIDDLGTWRSAELAAATRALGVDDVTLLAYADGALAEVPLSELAGHVRQRAEATDALLVFDESGVTGHPDHCAATQAALAVADALDLPVLAWALPQPVADALNSTFGTGFVGRKEGELDIVLEVDRGRQLAAIGCHSSQASENRVLWRRLEIQGNLEWLHWLRPSHGAR